MSEYKITVDEIDNLTGDKLSSKTKKTSVVKLPPEPAFVKMYLDDICKLTVCSDPARKLLSCILPHMDYDNRVILIKETKEHISKCSKMSMSHINKSINELKIRGILISIGRAYYLVNPKYFGKGRWINIEELRLNIVYNEEGVAVSVKRVESTNTEDIETSETPYFKGDK